MIFHKVHKGTGFLDKYKQVISRVNSIRSIGYIESIRGSLVRASGPNVNLHDICHIVSSMEDGNYVLAEVIGFEKNLVLLALLEELKGIKPGSMVVSLDEPLGININNKLIGRCINGLGLPMDGGNKIVSKDIYYLDNKPPSPLDRPIIKEPLFLGIRAIDALLTIGKGQRIGIFSGSGVGKEHVIRDDRPILHG